ncbi:hypothetical protein PGH12_08405 [Chryseobacterium wangxinyae]|uniref:hypothetical protein n=1 Tax=Chryseobacterium sp. CY350 TaxID=2997336 RepID=UPI0022710DB5|nr:hypothetical protein [Chryseobacterium sp. CY350]MCY0979391.1 hypothetical protein [Chryseobacterium sp. CY350]WBZ97160.1 hypothetical protein PGH12_08405 [Chryseobacterium sp. CY350]
MKKILITCSIVLSGLGFAQSSDDNSYVYEKTPVTQEDTFPGNPGDPNASPIDQYIPLLLLTAIGLVVVLKRKQKTV